MKYNQKFIFIAMIFIVFTDFAFNNKIKNKEIENHWEKIDFYISQLKSKNIEEQIEGAMKLTVGSNYTAIIPLINTIENISIENNKYTISKKNQLLRLTGNALSNISIFDLKHRNILYKFIKHKNPIIQEGVISALAMNKNPFDKKIIDYLLDFVRTSKHRNIRAKSSFLLSFLNDSRIPKVLMDILKTEKDPEVRRYALFGLRNYKRMPNAYSFFKRYISDRELKVVGFQINENKNETIEKQEEIDYYLWQLFGNSKTQIKSARELKRVNNYTVIEPLINLLDNLVVEKMLPGFFGQTKSRRLFEASRDALLGVFDKRGIEIFYKNLYHKNPLIKSLCITHLSYIMPEKLVDHLIYFLEESKNESVRRSALRALTRYKDSRLPKYLMRALKENNPEAKQFAMAAIGRYGYKKVPNASELIRQLVFDNNKRVSSSAIYRLLQINDPKMIKFLLKMMVYNNLLPRSRIASYMGDIKEIRAIEPLIDIIDYDAEIYVRKEAKKALLKITGKDFGNNLVKWRKWWKKNKRIFLKNVKDPFNYKKLCKKRTKEIYEIRIHKYIKDLKSPNKEIRKKAIDVISGFNNNRYSKYIIKTLNDNDIELRQLSIKALENINLKKAVKPLIDFIKRPIENKYESKHTYFFYRSMAIRILGRIGNRKAIKFLKKLVFDDDFKSYAKIALAYVGYKKYINEVINYLKEGKIGLVKNENNYKYMCEIAIKSKDPRFFSTLLKISLERYRPRFFGISIFALEKIDKNRLMNILSEDLESEDCLIQRRAMIALGILKHYQSFKRIYSFLWKLECKHKNLRVIKKTLLQLSEHKSTNTEILIQNALKSNNEEIVEFNLIILKQYKSKTNASLIINLLKHPSEYIRRKAASSLKIYIKNIFVIRQLINRLRKEELRSVKAEIIKTLAIITRTYHYFFNVIYWEEWLNKNIDKQK